MQLMLCTVLLVTVFCVLFAQEECITPTKSNGTCIPLTECKPLNPVKQLTLVEGEYLKQSQCDFKGEIPKVCCPSETITIRPIEKTTSTTLAPKPASQIRCVTRSGTFGYCVRLATCPKLSQMLKRASMEDLVYVHRSRCKDRGHFCCDITEKENIVVLSTKGETSKEKVSPNGPSTVSPFDLKPPCCGTESMAGNKIIEECITPTKSIGTCIPLNECKPLNPQKQLTLVEGEYLKQFQCDFKGEIPKVCCPSETITIRPIEKTTSTTLAQKPASQIRCVTRSGTFGYCVRLATCPKLSQMLKRASMEDLVYVHRSRCKDRGHFCCDITEKENNVVLSRRGETSKEQVSPKCASTVSPFDLKPPCCGTESMSGNKIIGGTTTSIDQYPWLAIIEYTKPFLCGGTLISSLYVLTAAHCLLTTNKISTGAKSVRLGDYNRTNIGPDCVVVEGGGEDCTNGTISIPIATIIAHENYGSETTIFHSDDIALIKLSEMAPYTDFIRPICLPTSDITQGQPTDLWFIIAGWGAVNGTIIQSDVKRHTNVPYVNQTHCRENVYGRRGTTVIWDKQMCAGGEFNKDSCEGDSGGPLMYSNDTYQQIFGVSSFGSKQCGNFGQPSIYTRVYDYLEWIKINAKP